MDFKQQYKTEMQNISPSEEQCERIRTRVYAEIQNPQSIQTVQKRKKPLPLKAIAITGASAACLVLVSALALQILPKKLDFAYGTGGAAPNGICAMEETNKPDAADDMNAGLGIGSEECYSFAQSETMDSISGSGAKSQQYSAESYMKPSSAESLAPGSLVVKIVFTEDMSGFELVKGSESEKYALSNEAPLTADNEALLEEFPAINSNIEKLLFIYSSGNKMWVYDENRQFIGCFIQIS